MLSTNPEKPQRSSTKEDILKDLGLWRSLFSNLDLTMTQQAALAKTKKNTTSKEQYVKRLLDPSIGHVGRVLSFIALGDEGKEVLLRYFSDSVSRLWIETVTARGNAKKGWNATEILCLMHHLFPGNSEPL